MKKILVIAMAAAVALTMGSCGGGKQQKVEFDQDSVEVDIYKDQTVYGLCGEGSAMNTLQIITDNGDTLNLNLDVAHEEDRVFGGYQVGDRMAVMLTKDKTGATIVINQTALLGDWVMPNPIDGDSEMGIRIKEGGIAESIEQSSIVYKTWRIFNGKLEILWQREGGGDMEESYQFELLKLAPDSLVYRDNEETYRYGRQKEPEKMDLHGLQLEDDADEFRID